jgi:hypothetical protein
MLRIVTKIAEGLDRLKGFRTGYSTATKDKLLVEIGGKVYLATIEELGEGEVEGFLNKL